MQLGYLSDSNLAIGLGSRSQNWDVNTEVHLGSRGGIYAIEIGTRKSHSVMSEATAGGLGTLHIRKIKSWLVLSSCHFILVVIDTIPSVCVYMHVYKCIFSEQAWDSKGRGRLNTHVIVRCRLCSNIRKIKSPFQQRAFKYNYSPT